MDLWLVYNIGKKTILVLTFWGHSQFGPYILIAINLLSVIFNLQSFWVPTVKSLTENVYVANGLDCWHA